MNTAKVKPLIIYPMDPLGEKIGGIETFLKGFIKYAPEDFAIEWIGVTSDRKKRPVGIWQELSFEGKKFKFFPSLYVKDENVRTKIPLSLKFTISLFQHCFPLEGRILEFHRIEPLLPFKKRQNKKILFVHGNMKDLYNPYTEIKWGKFPWLYFNLEKKLINRIEKIFVVREDGVKFYQERYPYIAERFSFLPTWVDEEIFYLYPDKVKKYKKVQFLRKQGFNQKDNLILFVGRLEGQKDPLLLIDTFYYVHVKNNFTKLLIVGKGSLRKKMEIKVRRYHLEKNVRFLGVMPQSKVAEIMRISDVFLLTSAFEGMPRSMLEALACGLPAVSMDVGEAKRVVKGGFSGMLVSERKAKIIGEAALDVLNKQENFNPQNCLSCIKNYTADQVLKKVYETYYQILKKKDKR